MNNSMYRMKSRELEVRGVLRGQRWIKNKKRRKSEQRIGLGFKFGDLNVEGM